MGAPQTAGDEGGPIFIPSMRHGKIALGNPTADKLIAITSYVGNCNLGNVSGIHILVNAFVRWINDTVTSKIAQGRRFTPLWEIVEDLQDWQLLSIVCAFYICQELSTLCTRIVVRRYSVLLPLLAAYIIAACFAFWSLELTRTLITEVFFRNVVAHSVKFANARLADIDEHLLGWLNFVKLFEELVLEKLGLKKEEATVVMTEIRNGSVDVHYKVVLRSGTSKEDIQDFWDTASENVPHLFDDDPIFAQYQAGPIQPPQFWENQDIHSAFSGDLLTTEAQSDFCFLAINIMRFAIAATVCGMVAFTIARVLFITHWVQTYSAQNSSDCPVINSQATSTLYQLKEMSSSKMWLAVWIVLWVSLFIVLLALTTTPSTFRQVSTDVHPHPVQGNVDLMHNARKSTNRDFKIRMSQLATDEADPEVLADGRDAEEGAEGVEEGEKGMGMDDYSGDGEDKEEQDEEPQGLTRSFTGTKQVCERDFPFIANVMNAMLQTHMCTGVLVKQDLVLVPASCVTTSIRDPGEFPSVRLGSYDLNTHDGPEEPEVLKTCQQIVHDKFTGKPEEGNDIALLVLNGTGWQHAPIKSMMPIDRCVPNKTMSSLGWFAPIHYGSPSYTLLAKPKLKHVERGDCVKALKDKAVPNGAVCAVGEVRAVASWDLGSPLLCQGEQLIGLESYAQSQPNVYMPYVYTHVIEYENWINTLGKDASRVLDNPDCEYCRKDRKVPTAATRVEL
eukprot:evm.model.scf_375EXC.3 EVM.evm.TU.scf_375EXC.3   scf_375EXC:32149-50201(+)